MNIICYKRVSTDDQADRGFSLQHQERMLRQYCEINGYNIVGMYTEDFSAKTFDRPEWKKILSYIKQNKKQVDLVLCLRWDRFSRNLYDALTTIKDLTKLGIKVNTIEQPLDLSNPDNKVLLSMYLTLPEVENDKNSKRTKDGMHRAQFEGCWTANSPRGYDNFRDGGRSTLKANQDAPLMTMAFERMATGSYSAEEVRHWLNKQGISISKQVFLNALRNPVYTGKIRVFAHGNEPEQIVMGLHPGIVSDDVFYRANEVLEGRKRNMKFHDDKTNIYPLKGYLTCPIHGTSLTAYACKNHMGNLYHYYICTKCKGTQRHPIDDVHQSIEDILSKISFNAQTLNLYLKMLEKLFDKEDMVRKDEIVKTENEIEKVKKRMTNLQDQFMDNHISPEEFQAMKQRVEKDLTGLSCKLKDLKSDKSPFKEYVKSTVPMLENLVEYYRKSDGKTKKKILSCIFSKKIVLEKSRVATCEFTTPINVLINASKVCRGDKNKKEVENDLLSCLALQVGLEPTTYGLTVRRSNQLSY